LTTSEVSTRTDSRGITLTWAALCALTVGAWWLSPAHPGGAVAPNIEVTVAVMVGAFIKCRLVIRYFMEVGTAPQWLQIATDSWLLILWLTVLGIYLT
jgi:caa(3)-type oxidase subunit IV